MTTSQDKITKLFGYLVMAPALLSFALEIIGKDLQKIPFLSIVGTCCFVPAFTFGAIWLLKCIEKKNLNATIDGQKLSGDLVLGGLAITAVHVIAGIFCMMQGEIKHARGFTESPLYDQKNFIYFGVGWLICIIWALALKYVVIPDRQTSKTP